MNQETHTHTDAPGVFEPRHTRPPREQSLAPHLLLADQALVAVCVRFMGVSVTPAPVGRARPVNAAAVQRLYVKGVILRSEPTGHLENEPHIRIFARRYAAHTHAQRVCRVSGNGFCAQARQDRCSGRPDRAIYSPTQRFRRALD